MANLTTYDPEIDDPFTFSFIAGDRDYGIAVFLIEDDALLSNRFFSAGDSKQLIRDIYLDNFKRQIVEFYHDMNSSAFTLYPRSTYTGLYILKIISGSEITFHRLMIQ